MASPSRRRRIALVLSGGGARGAYAVGVLSGLSALLGGLRSRFHFFSGTSVGAINAAHCAAHAESDDLGLEELTRQYTELRLKTHLRPHLASILGRSGRSGQYPSRRGWALLDSRPFERIVRHDIPWDHLHENVRGGLVSGVFVSGLRISDGRTTTFAELAPGTELVVGQDPRRDAVVGPITADHVLASAALPLLFPARRIDGAYYCDGGLRFNTPVAPAIRAGAERLVVIALRAGACRPVNALTEYPKPFFLLGKILDALLLDPIEYDLHVLARLNRITEVMEKTMTPAALSQVRAVVQGDRGLPYRQVHTLVFRPSKDIGVLAAEYMRSEQPARKEGLAARTLLRHASALGGHVEADFVSYLLFDGGFARLLIDLGYRDALSRAREVRAFFGGPSLAPRSAAESSSR